MEQNSKKYCKTKTIKKLEKRKINIFFSFERNLQYIEVIRSVQSSRTDRGCERPWGLQSFTLLDRITTIFALQR